MHYVSRIVVFQSLALLTIVMPARAQGIGLTQGVWELQGQDLIGWNESELKFTSQGADGSLAGYFDWLSDSHTGFGRELFTGSLLPDRSFTLHGYELVPHPTFGGPAAIVLADYAGQVTPDGRQIINGTWLGRTGVPGTWESVRTPEPSTALLLAIGGATLALRRHKARVGHGRRSANARSRWEVSRVQSKSPIAAALRAFSIGILAAGATLLSSGHLTAAIIGFGDGSEFTFNGFEPGENPIVEPGVLQITNQLPNEARTVFFNEGQDIARFNASFTYQALNAAPGLKYGVTFVLVRSSYGNLHYTDVGGPASGLGYLGIDHSAAISLELPNQIRTGLHTGGSFGLTTHDLLPSGIDLLSGHKFRVTLNYDGSTLAQTITDLTTSASFATSYAVNLPAAIDSPPDSTFAAVGFSGSTGLNINGGVDQYISDFVFNSVPEPASSLLLPLGGCALVAARRWKRCGRSQGLRRGVVCRIWLANGPIERSAR